MSLRQSDQPRPTGQVVKFHRVQKIANYHPEYFLSPWGYYKDCMQRLKARGAEFVLVSDIADGLVEIGDRIGVVLDHHIDYYPFEMEHMVRWDIDNELKGNVYLFNRSTGVDGYQPSEWGFKDLNVNYYKSLEQQSLIEIGYHQNAVGRAALETGDARRSYSQTRRPETLERARQIAAADISELEQYFRIRSFIPHGAGEGNAALIDLPDKLKDKHWVYNNARDKRPMAWKNYSDAEAVKPRFLGGKQICFVTFRDHMRLFIETAQQGKLHHILVHPGRSAKGMEYDEDSSIPFKIYNEVPDQPNSIRDILTFAVRDAMLGPQFVSPEPGVDFSVEWLLTDSLAVAATHVASNPCCIPFLLVKAPNEDGWKKNIRTLLKASPVFFTGTTLRHAHECALFRPIMEACGLDPVSTGDIKAYNQTIPFINLCFHTPKGFSEIAELPWNCVLIQERQLAKKLLPVIKQYWGEKGAEVREREGAVTFHEGSDSGSLGVDKGARSTSEHLEWCRQIECAGYEVRSRRPTRHESD